MLPRLPEFGECADMPEILGFLGLYKITMSRDFSRSDPLTSMLKNSIELRKQEQSGERSLDKFSKPFRLSPAKRTLESIYPATIRFG